MGVLPHHAPLHSCHVTPVYVTSDGLPESPHSSYFLLISTAPVGTRCFDTIDFFVEFIIVPRSSLSLLSPESLTKINAKQKVYNTPEMQRRTRAASPEDAAAPGAAVAAGRAREQQQQQQQQMNDEEGRDQKKTRSSSAAGTGEGVSGGGVDATHPSTGSLTPAPGGGGAGDHGGGGQQSFLSSIFLHLAEAREELESLAASKRSGKSSAGGEREEQAVRVRLERCLALVRGVIRGAPGVMTPAHSNRGMGLPWEVTVLIKSPAGKHLGSSPANNNSTAGAGGSSTSAVLMHAPPPPLATGTGAVGTATLAPTAASHSWTSGPPERYVLEVHPLETVGSLRKRVAATNGLGLTADYTRLLLNAKAITVDAATVTDAGVKDGCSLWTLQSSTALLDGMPVTSSVAQQHQQQAQRLRMEEIARRAGRGVGSASASAGGAVHDGDVIAEKNGPFEELFRLLECAHGLEVGGGHVCGRRAGNVKRLMLPGEQRGAGGGGRVACLRGFDVIWPFSCARGWCCEK